MANRSRRRKERCYQALRKVAAQADEQAKRTDDHAIQTFERLVREERALCTTLGIEHDWMSRQSQRNAVNVGRERLYG